NDINVKNKEFVCIENLKSFLSDAGMIFDNIKLLQEVKANSNTIFHSNKQSLEEVKVKLYDLLPVDIKIYKPSLQKILEAI
ncbi:2802_t:CDS:1, partial [Funneliformis caledonium]